MAEAGWMYNAAKMFVKPGGTDDHALAAQTVIAQLASFAPPI